MSLDTAEAREFANENVRVQIHHHPGCKVEFRVKASKQSLQKAKKEALKEVNKEVSLPGFRKGKAPEDVILKKFSADVERKSHKTLADLTFIEAQKLAHVPVLNKNSSVTFDLKGMTEEGADLVFSFETEPKIPKIDPHQFVPKAVERTTIGEKEIDEAVRQMMFFYAEWTPITDRTVQQGDCIILDLDTVEDGHVQRVFDKVRFEVVPERMAAWMRNLVLNAKSGDVLEGMSEPDADASDEEKATFKPKKVRLHLLKVEQAVLPSLDDAFAKKVGAASVDDMRKMITKLLEDKAEIKYKTALRAQVSEFLVHHYPFELPLSLIEAEKKHRLSEHLKNPEGRKAWDQMSSERKKEIEQTLMDESSQAVRLFYLSRGLIREENVPITHQEVQEEAVSTLRSFGAGHVDLDQISKEVYALALSKVILAKAQDHILQRAQKA